MSSGLTPNPQIEEKQAIPSPTRPWTPAQQLPTGSLISALATLHNELDNTESQLAAGLLFSGAAIQRLALLIIHIAGYIAVILGRARSSMGYVFWRSTDQTRLMVWLGRRWDLRYQLGEDNIKLAAPI